LRQFTRKTFGTSVGTYSSNSTVIVVKRMTMVSHVRGDTFTTQRARDDVQSDRPDEEGIQVVDELRREMSEEVRGLRDEAADQRRELLAGINAVHTDQSEFRARLGEIRGDLKALDAQIRTATWTIVTVVTLTGSNIGILAALGVFS
jgi:hypothetical protein